MSARCEPLKVPRKTRINVIICAMTEERRNVDQMVEKLLVEKYGGLWAVIVGKQGYFSAEVYYSTMCFKNYSLF